MLGQNSQQELREEQDLCLQQGLPSNPKQFSNTKENSL